MKVRQRTSDGAERGRRPGWAEVLWLMGLALFAAAPLVAQEVGALTATGGAGSTTARIATADDGLSVLTMDPEADGAIGIDGLLDEPAWARAEAATGFVQQVPMEGSAATEATLVRILVDRDAIYIGATLNDREPDRVLARLARRDEPVHSDWLYVYLDSYDDDRTAFGFGVNAAGIQRDLRIASDRDEDGSWDAVWESAATLTQAGWTAEIRIPLSQLRFNPSGPEGRWGVNFERLIARKNETVHWAAVPQGLDRFVSLFAELRGVAALESTGRLEVVPYTVGRVTRAPGSADNPFHRATDPFGAVGADVRMGLGSSLTLSATLNPDFGQVEADPATVNLTAFETFQEERRPFFVEGSDIFRLGIPFWPPFFYSRRIGRAPQGPAPVGAVFQDRPAATTILGALKLSGKTESGWSIGILDAVTSEERTAFADDTGALGQALVEPRTNSAVVRVAKELRGGESGIGVMATSVHRNLGAAPTSDLDFLHNQAYGFAVDAFHRFRDGRYSANASLITSHVRGSRMALQRTQRAPGHYFGRPDAEYLTFDPDRRSLTGMSFVGRLQKVRGSFKWGTYVEATSPGYEVSDLGFNPTLDHLMSNAWVFYENFEAGPVFQRWDVGTSVSAQSSWGQEIKQLSNEAWFNFQLRNYWGAGAWVSRLHPAWSTTTLRGGPALRTPGGWQGSFNLNSDPRNALTGNGFVFWQTEDETKGYRVNGSATVTLRPSDRVEVSAGPFWSVARTAAQFVDRQEVDGQPLWIVGDLDRRTASLTARLNITTTPTTSLQIYARPFLASGSYRAIRETVDPQATRFTDRFRTYGRTPDNGTEPSAEEDARRDFEIDRDGDGLVDLTVNDPSFNIASLQMNTVLRWEYRPGSALFLVWTHDRDAFGNEALDLTRDFERLLDQPARNVFMVKVSYWLGF